MKSEIVTHLAKATIYHIDYTMDEALLAKSISVFSLGRDSYCIGENRATFIKEILSLR